MGGNWREYQIGEIAEISGGSTPSTADPANFNGEIPWLTPKDLSGPHDRYVSRGERNLSRKGLECCSAKLLPACTVLITSRAPIGYVAIAKNPIATNQGFRNLVLKPGFDSGFLYYWVRAHIEELQRYSSGSTFQELSGSALAQIRIRVPPLPEQRAIAHILGTLDDKIELNRRMSQTLEEMARAIFKSWFVDFDPVRAKAAVRREHPDWTNAQVTRAAIQRAPGCLPLQPEIAELFPDSFVDSELGEIPEGWGIASFTDGVDVIGGGTPITSNPGYWGGDIPWFSVIDTPKAGEVFTICTEKSVTQLGIDNSSARILPVGTTIISARGTVGNLALVGVPMAMNQSCYGLRDRREMAGDFLYFATHAVVETLRQRGHGSVFNTITRDTLNGVRVVAPPYELVAAFERVIGGLLLRLLASLHQSRTLSALRDALLPKLISGELRVPDAERIVERIG